MVKTVKKAVVPSAGLGTRFLPLSKVLPKEFWPLVDKPVIQYIIEETLISGIKDVIFVSRPGKKMILDYLKGDISFTNVFQKKPLGDGHAVLQAKSLIKNEPFAVMFGDDVVESKMPCLKQLLKIFKKYQRPVLALYRLPRNQLPFYGIVGVKKIGKRLYEIKKIVEKPEISQAPSNLTIVGKYILTPDVFNYLEKEKGNAKKEIILAAALMAMIKDGKKVFGLEFEGKWLECGNKLAFLRSNLYLCLKHPEFGRHLKKLLK